MCVYVHVRMWAFMFLRVRACMCVHVREHACGRACVHADSFASQRSENSNLSLETLANMAAQYRHLYSNRALH